MVFPGDTVDKDLPPNTGNTDSISVPRKISCKGAAKLMPHDYLSPCSVELTSHNYWSLFTLDLWATAKGPLWWDYWSPASCNNWSQSA